jgi:hypothetical protein
MVTRPVAQQDRRAPRTDRTSKPRGRRAKKLIVVLVVLAGLLVGADFGLAAFAEHTISQKARAQLGLADDPSVSVHGFPFTTQALSGDYSQISVSAAGVRVAKLSDVELSAELKNVTAPLSELLAGNTKAIKIGTLQGAVTIKASDIARISPLDKVEDLKIEPSTQEYVTTGKDTMTDAQRKADAQLDKPQAGIRLSGYVQIAGQKVEIFCFAMIEVKDKAINITPHRLQFGNDKATTVVPGEVQKALLPSFGTRIDGGQLPFNVQPTAIRVNSGSVTLKGEAKDVTFSGASLKG